MKVTEKKRAVKPEMLQRHDTWREEQAKKKKDKTADKKREADKSPEDDDAFKNAPKRGKKADVFAQFERFQQ